MASNPCVAVDRLRRPLNLDVSPHEDMNIRLISRSSLVGLTLLTSAYAHASDDFYSEVRFEEAVRAILLGGVSLPMRSNIEGAAAALSYAYDCSNVSPGFLRSFARVADGLVQYSKTPWGKLSGPEYGNLTVAGALHSHVVNVLKCRRRD